MFETQSDIEIAALLVAAIAWGNRKQIIASCRKMLFDIMDGKPAYFVTSGARHSIDPAINIHRTFFGRDLIYMCKGLQAIYGKGGSLEDMFAGKESVWEGIAAMRGTFYSANGSYSKHISNPHHSACKRLNMMLRWLCRHGSTVDLGIWHKIKPSSLMIPLDTHVAHTARTLGLVDRRANDRRTVEMLTAKLCEFCPQDPAKYDFALFGIGEQGLLPQI
jgi:uncharacterized protein (TIGR02757 family)